MDRVSYDLLDYPVRQAVRELNRKNIFTNSSESGGGPNHGTPDFAYIEAHLSSDNILICRKTGYLLDKVYGKNSGRDFLFNGSGLAYGEQTGFHVIGFNRRTLDDSQVEQRFQDLLSLLIPQ